MIEFITANLGMIENTAIILTCLMLFNTFCTMASDGMESFDAPKEFLSFIGLITIVPFIIVMCILIGLDMTLLHIIVPTMSLKQLFVISLLIDSSIHPLSYGRIGVISRLERILKAHGINTKANMRMK